MNKLQADPEVSQEYRELLLKALQYLEDWLGEQNGFLTGELSIADIYGVCVLA